MSKKRCRYQLTRRSFIGAGLAGLGSLMLTNPLKSLRADQHHGPKLPFCITMRAGGGWDPTLFCDPIVNDPRYTDWKASDILRAGEISYAPFNVAGGVPIPYSFDGQDFFQKHASNLVVLNGIDHETASHDVGPRVAFSGTSREGMPSISGLVAGIGGRGLALPYLVSGGYASTQDMVPMVRVAGGKTLEKIVLPNMLGPNVNKAAHHRAVHEMIRAARLQRDGRLSSALPSRAHQEELVRMARNETNNMGFAALGQHLDEFKVESDNDAIVTTSAIVAAMKAGVCTGAHVTYNGQGSQFDTHDRDHKSLSDRDGHRPALLQLFEAIDYVLHVFNHDAQLAERGLVLIVGSEFGRTAINGEDGKDHWNIGSLMVFTAGSMNDVMEGGRVVGKTLPEPPNGAVPSGAFNLRAKIVAGAWEYTDDVNDPAAIRLTPAHMHVALRDLLGLSDSHLPDQPLSRFKLPGVDPRPLPFFKS